MAVQFCKYCGKQLTEDVHFCPACGKEVTHVCPACGAKLIEGARFCQKCGTSLALSPPPKSSVFCPKCGKENLPTSKFCQQCGTSLVPAPAPPPQSVAGKQVSEPRADIVVNEKEKSHLKRMSTISTSLGIVLAVVAIIIFVYFAKAGNSESMAGSGVDGQPMIQTTTTGTSTTTGKTTVTTTTTTTGKTLNDLLDLSSNIISVKYDMSISGQSIPTTTATVWAKKNRMRMEMAQQGMNVITLIDTNAKTMYAYMPAQNMAMKIPFDPAQVPKSPTEDAKSLQNSGARVVDTETMDGKVCTVVEFTSGQGSGRMWIWQDKGLPIRVETTTPAGKITVEYKNMDLADIPDSMFELPAGVKIM